MSLKDVVWLKISGVCGILTPIVTFTCILLAIASYPEFSWTGNALSDLGVQEGATAILFNSGLIVSGILALLFASGLFIFLRDKLLGKIGAFIFVLGALALIAIGIFPETIKPMHYYSSVAFFVLLPLAMFVIGATFLIMARVRMGLFSFLAAIVAAVVWVIQFSMRLVPSVAVPEAVSALSALMWFVVLGFKMLKQASHSNK
jgi:hypothetical membrane protein